MKAKEIFETTAALMFASSQGDKEEAALLFIPVLNIFLQENLEANNTLRCARDKELLSKAPYIKNMEEDVDFEDEMTRQILPFGCAAYLLAEDEEGISADYKNKYEYERTKVLCAVYEMTEDVWNA